MHLWQMYFWSMHFWQIHLCKLYLCIGKNWTIIGCCKNKQIDRSSDDLYCTNLINLIVTSHRYHFKNTKNSSKSGFLLINSVNTFLIW